MNGVAEPRVGTSWENPGVKVVLAGGSGFLGNALRAQLLADGHAVANLTRRATPAAPGDITWTPDGTASGDWAKAIDDADAVVNLAGEGIADARWSEARKRSILESRLLSTRSLVAALRQTAKPPAVFVSASAVGYYGPRGDEIVTEATPPGSDFLANVCVQWEREADQASPVTRVVLVRSGIVLHPEGGALAKMLLPFRFGIGGPIGSGTQYTPWIHRDDWVDLVRWLIGEPAARGAFNATAPEPVRNAEFARALGRALRRPAMLPVPGIALRILFGELAGALLTGQRAMPARAEEMGFTFRFARLDDALADLFSRA
jgi:uncharacterized protein (TIGR01777 family)